MEWDDKTKMIQLGNVYTETEENRKEYQDFVLSHLDNFDGQAWDMFSQLTHINIEEMEIDVDFWTKIYTELKDVDCNNERFGFRSGFRIALIQTICENELLLNK